MRSSRFFGNYNNSKRPPFSIRRPLCSIIGFVFTLFLVSYSYYSYSQIDTTYSIVQYYIGPPSTTLHYAETILKNGNQIFLIIANANSTDGQFESIVAIDEYGQELNSVSIIRNGKLLVDYPANSAIINREGDILFAYGDISNGPNIYDGYLTKLTPDLDTLWTKTYDLPPALAGCPADTFVGNYFTAIRETLDGGYIIAGNYRLNCQPGTISDRACLLKVDTAGQVEWWQVYPNHNRIFDIEVTTDSGFVILEVKNPGFYITQLDKEGTIQWQSSLDQQYTHKVGQDVELINDSIVAVAGIFVYDDTPATTLRGLDFFLFDIKNKSLITSHYYIPYHSIRCATLHQSLKLQKIDNGFIIAATGDVWAPDSSEVEHKGVLFKLDENGDSIWCRYYGYGSFSDQCQFNDVLVMDDGNYLAAGFHFPWITNPGAWLVRTDSNGYAPGSYPTGIEKPAPLVSNINLYPNPANNITYIGGLPPELDWQEIELLIFDISGRLQTAMKARSSGGVVQIDLAGLRKGVYFIQLALPGGHSLVKKLIKL